MKSLAVKIIDNYAVYGIPEVGFLLCNFTMILCDTKFCVWKGEKNHADELAPISSSKSLRRMVIFGQSGRAQKLVRLFNFKQ